MLNPERKIEGMVLLQANCLLGAFLQCCDMLHVCSKLVVKNVPMQIVMSFPFRLCVN